MSRDESQPMSHKMSQVLFEWIMSHITHVTREWVMSHTDRNPLCMCVCVRERERERECVCVCVCESSRNHVNYDTWQAPLTSLTLIVDTYDIDMNIHVFTHITRTWWYVCEWVYIYTHVWYRASRCRSLKCVTWPIALCEMTRYGVATISRLLKIIGLFCRI